MDFSSYCSVSPEIEIAPESSTVLNGTSGVLNCSARGDPIPSISWRRNGMLIMESDPRFLVHGNGSLAIVMVTLNDMGMFQCFARNELGTDSSDSVLLTIDGELL